MSSREIELFIFDIFIAMQKIKKVVASHNNVQELLYDFVSWDCIIREFEIIGEASKYLLKEELLETDYQKVVDFRNQIVHKYFGIDQDIVWEIVNIDLVQFESIILELIENIKVDLKQELINSFIEDNNYLEFIVEELKKLNTN